MKPLDLLRRARATALRTVAGIASVVTWPLGILVMARADVEAARAVLVREIAARRESERQRRAVERVLEEYEREILEQIEQSSPTVSAARGIVA